MFSNFTTEEECYWLGFIYADGTMIHYTNRNAYVVRIHCSNLDFKHIEKFSIFVNKPIYKYDKSCIVQLYDSKLYHKLQDLGLCPNKSKKSINLPLLPESMMPHFIRGYFDGDGCITNSDGQSKFVLTNGHPKLLEDISYILFNIIDSKQKIYSYPQNTYQLQVRGNIKTSKVYDYLYNQSSIFLERKKNKWDKYRS